METQIYIKKKKTSIKPSFSAILSNGMYVIFCINQNTILIQFKGWPIIHIPLSTLFSPNLLLQGIKNYEAIA